MVRRDRMLAACERQPPIVRLKFSEPMCGDNVTSTTFTDVPRTRNHPPETNRW